MVRSSKKARRLIVGNEAFLWSLGHEHRVEQGQNRDAAKSLPSAASERAGGS